MRKRLLLVLLPPLVLAAAAFGGWYWWTAWRFMQSTDDAYIRADTTIISPTIEGTLKEVRVEDNQWVEKDQILFLIDPEDEVNRVKQAEAAVATEDATLDTFDRRVTLQETLIDQAWAAKDMAQADVTRTETDLKRYTTLLTSAVASKQQFDTAEADAHKAAAGLARAKAALAAEQNQLAVYQAQKTEQRTRLAQARASLALAKTQLDDTIIRAPVAGVVGNRAGQTGQYVKPGMLLAALVPLPHVYITANFKETQLTRMRPGQPVEVIVDAYPDKVIEGRVESFSPGSGAEFSLLPPDNATGNFTKIVQRVPVRIAVPSGGPLAALLRPGLSVEVTVDTRAPGEATAEGAIVGAAQAATAPHRD